MQDNFSNSPVAPMMGQTENIDNDSFIDVHKLAETPIGPLTPNNADAPSPLPGLGGMEDIPFFDLLFNFEYHSPLLVQENFGEIYDITG